MISLTLPTSPTLCAAGTTLTVGTQASTKVYRLKPDREPSRQKLLASVDEDALLLYTPDPLVPFAQSAYAGSQRFDLAHSASLVAIDWLSSGRASCGERWAFESYESRTELYLGGQGAAASGSPALVEALSLSKGWIEQRAMSFDIGGVARDAAVSVIVAGPRAAKVVERLHDAAAVIAQRRSGGSARDAREGSTPSLLNDAAVTTASGEDAALGTRLLGDMMLGVCNVEVTQRKQEGTTAGADVAGAAAGADVPAVVTVARLVAEHNEDIYRLLHFCLAPLAPEVGVVSYSDRIHATVAAAPAVLDAVQKTGGRLGEHRNEKWRRAPVVRRLQETAEAALAASAASAASAAAETETILTHAQLLRVMHLCDTTLPTGGFAHSGGLEAALQFGLLGSRRGASMLPSLRELGTTAALSAVQQQAPFALAAHALVTDALPRLRDAAAVADGPRGAWPADDVEAALSQAMAALNAQQHALLAANGPACRASLLQGNTLARIASSWLGGAQASKEAGSAAAAAARGVHILPARQAFGAPAHGAPALGALAALLGLPARTVVDAFIYMTARDFFSAAVRLNLVGPLAAVSLQSDVVEYSSSRSADVTKLSCAEAAGAAPLLDAAHVCHDLLERRIFQT